MGGQASVVAAAEAALRFVVPESRQPCGFAGWLQRGAENHGTLRREFDLEQAGLKQVFRVGEAALALDQVFGVVVPIGRRQKRETAVGLHEQRRHPVIRLNLEARCFRPGTHVQIHVGVRERVKIPVGKQRLDSQLGLRGAAFQRIADQHAVFAARHDDLARQHDIADAVAEQRPGADLGLAQIFVPLGEKVAGMLAAGEEELVPAKQQRFFQRRQQHVTSRRAVEIGDEKSVITARVARNDGAGGVISQTVGFQPLQAQRFTQVLAYRFVVFEVHVCSLLRALKCGIDIISHLYYKHLHE